MGVLPIDILLTRNRKVASAPFAHAVPIGVPYAREPLHAELKYGFVAAAARSALRGGHEAWHMTTTTDPTASVDPRTVARLPRAELDERFRRSPSGPIPAGRARGTAIIFPGSAFNGVLSRLIRALIWKGKDFSPVTGDLKNLIGPFGIRLIRAKVYQDQSWFGSGPAIILDYSKTSVVAGMIRDEIREIGPGVYLGQVYWGKRRIALFMLEFPVATP